MGIFSFDHGSLWTSCRHFFSRIQFLIRGDNYGDHFRRNNRRTENLRPNSRNRSITRENEASTSRRMNYSNRGPRCGANNKRSDLEQVFNEQDRNEQRKLEEHRQKRHFGFKKFEALLSEDVNDMCITLRNSRDEFSNLLKSTEIKNDWVVVIVKLMEKIVKHSTIDNNVQDVIILFCHEFIKHLKKYLALLPFQSPSEKSLNTYYWNDPKSFWEGLIIVCNKIIHILPQSALDQLPALIESIRMAASHLERKNTPIDAKLLDEIGKIEERLAIILFEIESEKKYDGAEQDEEEIEMPLGDFRDVNILPAPEEILTPQQPIIRENKIDGRYISVNHYLDVQFRLLREDFIAPLREGICNYLEDRNHFKKFDNIRIYPDVTFHSTDFLEDKFSYIINLNLEKKFLEKIENSKTLINESLLVFSENEFKTIILATVANRDTELLRKGQIGVELKLGSSVRIQYLMGKKYKMIESEIYFEPYYQVLKSLQTITEKWFPLKKYIIDLEMNSRPPMYVEQNPNFKIKNCSVNVLSSRSWVTAGHLGYDESQYNAFKSALTKEFSVIQGPPGTGKTYIGLEIVDTLLKNNSLWYKNSPILIVCYTNHALDQFLEGILKLTNDVARMGGQSKNENMAKINIRELRRSRKMNNTFPAYYRQQRFEIRKNMKDCLDKIKKFQISLQQIYDNDCLIDVREEMSKKNIMFETSDQFFRWLLYRTVYIEKGALVAVEQLFLKINFNPNENDLHHEIIDNCHYLREVSDFRGRRWIMKSFEENEMNDTEYQKVYYSQLQLERDSYIKFRLQQNVAELPTPKDQVVYKFNLDPDNRWSLYWDCVNVCKEKLLHRLDSEKGRYNSLKEKLEEIRQIEDVYILRTNLVVGMTTTGAAKYRTVLKGIRSPIVIVEEAAEVLESHIITSLTDNCQHLILIGDHKQLRPIPAVYRLAKDFNLDISLFERMVRNGMHCEVLGVQHRMRWEFARLIVPAIYPNLENHRSVLSYENIMGVRKNLFFINHNYFEETVGDSKSKQNYHEANFLLRFCGYLLLQGYKPQDITILTTYNGQMSYLHKQRNKMELLRDVRITVVDNFQGEESKIILLSLVRSNAGAKIGFLGIENRVCVALSRARQGLYIIGNMNILMKNPLWEKIKHVLEQQNAIGNQLALQCKIHRDRITYVKCADDFQQCPEGGCGLICNLLLSCGHRCTSLCHVQNREHKNYKCLMPCRKIICERNHLCPNLCCKPCGPCLVLVPHILPCGHRKSLHCHLDPSTYNCAEIVTKQLPCGHKKRKLCFADVKKVSCSHACENRLHCGHKYT